MKSSKRQDALKQHNWWHGCPPHHVVLRVAPPPPLAAAPAPLSPQSSNCVVVPRILAAAGHLRGLAAQRARSKGLRLEYLFDVQDFTPWLTASVTVNASVFVVCFFVSFWLSITCRVFIVVCLYVSCCLFLVLYFCVRISSCLFCHCPFLVVFVCFWLSYFGCQFPVVYFRLSVFVIYV